MNPKQAPTGLLLLTVALVLATSSPAAGSAPAPDARRSDFVPDGTYLLSIDGADRPEADIYRSRRAAAYLLVAPPYHLLLDQRAGTIQDVPPEAILARPDGSVDLAAGVPTPTAASFTRGRGQIAFRVDGRTLQLRPKPPLLGTRTGAELLQHSPQYAVPGRAAKPSAAVVEALRGADPRARVTVYFGSWCPTCRRHLPAILALEKALEGTSIAFSYHGLPKDRRATQRAGVRRLPTGVVYVDGRERTRIVGGEFRDPGRRLLQIIRSAR